MTKPRIFVAGIATEVNTFSPIFIVAADPDTLDKVAQFYPLGWVGEPEDVAAVVAFVASDAARAITGSEVLVDCGLMAGTGQLGSLVTKDDRRVDSDPGGDPLFAT